MDRTLDQQKVALITGAAGDIGSAICREFARAGAMVIGIDKLEVPPRDIPFSRYFSLQLGANERAVQELRRISTEISRLDYLVNVAGIAGPRGSIENVNLSEVAYAFDVNVGSCIATSSIFPDAVRQSNDGSIVNISSIAGTLGYATRSVYAATKFAIVGLTKSLAIEFGPSGVRVNAVAPGAVLGPSMESFIQIMMTEKGCTREEALRPLIAQSIMGRLVNPQDEANQVVFLCSTRAKNITGQIIGVDAGTVILN
jgi:NAD(P)-dependent dehydrogenase (short-subunit alcohol dehydrogenase family)